MPREEVDERSLIRTVERFLAKRCHRGDRLLLGLSGGPDSLALFYLLRPICSQLSLGLHLAHVDHGWREESRQEAEVLKKLAEQCDIPFYLKRLDSIPQTNREGWARQQRIDFFTDLHRQHPFRALLLAHHLGDQVETVLKRVLEGARLSGLGGLVEERKWEGGLWIWRPLLSIPQQSLKAYLIGCSISPFHDQTNENTQYLRARMRKKILPYLEEMFGKRAGDNLFKLGRLCQEVDQYFSEKSWVFFSQLVKGPFGAGLDLTCSFHPLELKCFLHRYVEEHGGKISHQQLECLVNLIEKQSGRSSVRVSPLLFVVNRWFLFILSSPFPKAFSHFNRWQEVERGDWLNFWRGEICYPKGYSQILHFHALPAEVKKRLKRWYAEHRVPPFLQDKGPVFLLKDQRLGECLTGKPFVDVEWNESSWIDS